MLTPTPTPTLTPTPTPTPTTPNFNCNSPPFLIKIKRRAKNMLKIKRDTNQQDLKIVDLHFVKSKYFSLTWRCGSHERDTASSGWIFKLNNLAVKGLIPAIPRQGVWKKRNSCNVIHALPRKIPPSHELMQCITIFIGTAAEWRCRSYTGKHPQPKIASILQAEGLLVSCCAGFSACLNILYILWLTNVPANMIRWPNYVLLLGQRRW